MNQIFHRYAEHKEDRKIVFKNSRPALERLLKDETDKGWRLMALSSRHYGYRAVLVKTCVLITLLFSPALADINTLTWLDKSETTEEINNQEDGFRVYRSINGSTFVIIAVTLPDATSYVEDVPREISTQTVCYGVDAFNKKGTSDLGGPVCKTIPACEQKGKSGQCH